MKDPLQMNLSKERSLQGMEVDIQRNYWLKERKYKRTHCTNVTADKKEQTEK